MVIEMDLIEQVDGLQKPEKDKASNNDLPVGAGCREESHGV